MTPASSRFVLTLIGLAALASTAGAQNIPPPYNPGSMGDWYGPFESSERILGWDPEDDELFMPMIKTLSYRFRVGALCVGIGDPACGGGFTVPAGTEVEFPGGAKVKIKLTHTFEAVPDPCVICNVYVCATAIEMEFKETRKEVRILGGGYSKTTTKTTYGVDTNTAVLKQACDESQEARDFCCPDEEEPAPESVLSDSLSLAPGDAEVGLDRFALGPATVHSPPALDFTSVAAFLPLQLGVTDFDMVDTPIGPIQRFYAAASLDELSYYQRFELQEAIITLLEHSGTVGHVVIVASDAAGSVTQLDVGTLDQILMDDTLCVENPADVDMDGDVDDDDLLLVQADFGTNLGMARGDLNMDGFVNEEDIEIVLQAM